MFCVSIQEKDFDKCVKIIELSHLFEVRMDLCHFTYDELAAILHKSSNAIITCRIVQGDEQHTLQTLLFAIKSGARYVDIEAEASQSVVEELKDGCTKCGTKLIISYHNFDTTPTLSELVNIYNECRGRGADLVKIVTTANSDEDGDRVMQLYSLVEDAHRLVAFAMGEWGRATRRRCLDLGAKFTYVAFDESSATADGQYTLAQMQRMVSEAKI